MDTNEQTANHLPSLHLFVWSGGAVGKDLFLPWYLLTQSTIKIMPTPTIKQIKHYLRPNAIFKEDSVSE
jgi:hypothetical protein